MVKPAQSLKMNIFMHLLGKAIAIHHFYYGKTVNCVVELFCGRVTTKFYTDGVNDNVE